MGSELIAYYFSNQMWFSYKNSGVEITILGNSHMFK